MKPTIINETADNWCVLIDAKNAERLKDYLRQESDTSVGSHPEHFGYGTDEMVLLVTKTNISREQPETWLNNFQP
jgi:hypothetical protein